MYRFDREAYEKRVAWFRQARLGMFIHWGLYALPVRGEWVRSNERMPLEDYQRYFDAFTAPDCDPRQWAQAAKAAGMRYMVFTAKHHDGFCLFDSKLTDYTSVHAPCHRDFVAEYVTAAREDVTATVDIRPYLPADVSLADTGFDGRVTLTALVEPILHRTFEFDTDAVQILNIPENWLAELVAGQKISVTVYGLQADLNAIEANSLTPHTDVDTLKDADGRVTPGEQDIEIRFLMPDNVRQEAAVTARIRLVELRRRIFEWLGCLVQMASGGSRMKNLRPFWPCSLVRRAPMC